MNPTDYKQLVASCVARGLVQIPPQPDFKQTRPAKIPELAGLHQRTPEARRIYHRLYMRLRRKGSI